MAKCVELLPITEQIWKKVVSLAGIHCVSGLLYSQIKQLPQSLLPPRKLIMQLFAKETHQLNRYRQHIVAAQRFASTLKGKNVEMKVLKGISFSTYYDNPALREFGDCDVFLTNNEDKECMYGANAFETGNSTIKEIGGTVDEGNYKHSLFYLDKLRFENHHYISNFDNTKNGKRIELLLENAICSSPGSKIESTIDGQTKTTDLIRPNVHFNALFLIFHAQHHFISEGINLRMIYDWAVMLRAEQNNIEWERLYEDFDKCKLRMFADALTLICVKHLGLTVTSSYLSKHLQELNETQKHTSLAKGILDDTFSDNIHIIPNEPFRHKVLRILSRYKRFWHYKELLSESIPMMIWNSIAFSSYMKRRITLSE